MSMAPTNDIDWEQLCPAAVKRDDRSGYSGYLVPADKLVAVATALRDRAGYAYLTSVTAVDYPATEKMEVVYHLCRLAGGPPLVLKAQTDRADPLLPSLTPVFPSADFQEREAWDLFGIRFVGHPNLQRILLWEGFQGHPLRKDWHEPYYEQDHKPFDSRWPNGHVQRAEDFNPFHDNVHYPPDFTLEGWQPQDEEALYSGMVSGVSDHAGLESEQMIVNLGPQHPSTHGVLRLIVTLDGETVRDLQPVMGYLHRNHEKIGERNTFVQNIPYTDRLDYLCSMSNNLGYVLAVEKLLGVRPPPRAEYLRVMMVELTRVLHHLLSIGFWLNELGAYFTPVLYAFNERELILDIFEATAGSRMMCNYMRFGGVARDLPAGALETVRELVYERLPRKVDEFDAYLTENEIIRARSVGVGVLSAAEAAAYGVSGPVLRGSGVPYDVRRADPYSVYSALEFDVVTYPHGDVYDRYLVRLGEMRQSLRILQQVVQQMPGGEIMAGKIQPQMRVPAGEAYGRVENPKGELGFYVVSDGTANPHRYHIRAPSFINLTPLRKMCVGHKLADAVVILGSIDVVMGEVDR